MQTNLTPDKTAKKRIRTSVPDGAHKKSLVLYKAENRYIRNKTKKLRRHLKNQPNDSVASNSLKNPTQRNNRQITGLK